MYRTATSNRAIGSRFSWAVTTAMAGALLSGCTTAAAPRADLSAGRAEAALAEGKHRQAVAHAEAAVLAEPRNAAYRAMLGNAYLDAGRFASAATTFDDAMALGDASPRTALSLALAQMGQGQLREAATLLRQWEGRIAPADLGLALALSGEPDRGVQLMSDAIRGGHNDAKIRQNLAYAYALSGRWREARLMAAQDVPADQLGDRIEQWAMMAQPDAWQQRVVALLQVPAAVSDAGQPVSLALSNNPSLDQLAAEASPPVALAAVEPSPLPLALAALAGELPAVAAPVEFAPSQPMPVTTAVALQSYEAPDPVEAAVPDNNFETAFAAPALLSAAPAAPALAAAEPATFAPPAVLQAPAARRPAARPAPAPASSTQAADGTHLIQLGSFASEQGAQRAWGIYLKNYPELSGHQMVISEAMVRGKRYFRVSAAGFGRSSSSSMCGRVKASGEGCFAYAEGRPLPGAVDRGIRLARR